MAAVLSCAAANQNRASDESALKSAYHSFQASAGMFTYINENFLHAPSTDLSRETVKTLIHVTLAQAQEIFLEKQVADQKKVGLLAKLAAQAGYLYGQAVEGVQENVQKSIFERVWLLVVQVWFRRTAMRQAFDQLLTKYRLKLISSIPWQCTIKRMQTTMRTSTAALLHVCKQQKVSRKRLSGSQGDSLQQYHPHQTSVQNAVASYKKWRNATYR